MQRQAEPGMNRRRDRKARHRTGWRTVPVGALITVILLMLVSPVKAVAASATAPEHAIEDAERFAKLMRDTGFRPSGRELLERYIEPGTPALTVFLARRAVGPEALGVAVAGDRAAYRWAMERCLPAARTLASRWSGLAGSVATALHVDAGAPASSPVFLVGAGRSAGTVQGDDVLLALEVVCRYVRPDDAAGPVLEGFAVHELVHVHQLHRQRAGQPDSLLRQALIEGFADYVAGRLLGAVPAQERERDRYGRKHEARLWAAFSAERQDLELGYWMYGPGRPGEPADLGYWLGKRICAAYVDAVGDEPRALRDLLELRDAEAILARSGYAERFAVP